MLEPMIRGSRSKEWKKALPWGNQWDTFLGIIAADSLATILGVTRCCSILVQRDNEKASMPHYARTSRHRTATIRSDFSRRNYDIDKPVSAAPDHDY